jgi:dihydrofolate synthase/folylpolyglutamate synthase
MNWISNYVRPRINSLFSRRELPENLWTKCDGCGTMLFHRELAENLNVCSSCGHHMAIAPRARFAGLFDGGVYAEVPVPAAPADPLQFRDQKRYPDRLRAAQKAPARSRRCWSPKARWAAPHRRRGAGFQLHGRIDGDVCRQCDRRRRRPRAQPEMPADPVRGGGRCAHAGRHPEPDADAAHHRRGEMLREARLPYVVVLTDPTTGGVTASYAMLGDVQIAEPGALICFAGPRVIEQTIREKLPDGFQRAEYLLDHGMLDRVTDRRRLREELISILRMLTGKGPPIMGDLPPPGAPPEPVPEATAPPADPPGATEGRSREAAPQRRHPDRMMSLHPKLIDLTLDRVWRCWPRLTIPRALPPVIHMAGTNGKGSTVAMLRAGLEAAGGTVHAYTSPHLVRFHERIRLSGQLISEARLTEVLDECERANAGTPITYFEITTVARFWPSPETRPTGACWRSGWAGGSTRPMWSTGRADGHHAGLVRPSAIPRRHAGRDRRRKGRHPETRRALCGGPQPAEAMAVIEARARAVGAPLDRDWTIAPAPGGGLTFGDSGGTLALPRPRLPGAHQIDNAGTAIAALRKLGLPDTACAAALSGAEWPARMQLLTQGPLVDAAPGIELWLDGGHNAAAGQALAAHLATLPERPSWMILGMLATKDAAAFLAPFPGRVDGVRAVTIPDEDAAAPAADLAATARTAGLPAEPAASPAAALAEIAAQEPGARVLICGSLYLAGRILRENG